MISPSRDGRATRWDAHRKERRRTLLRAVREAITVHGEDVSMEQISQASGITKPVLYRYFGDRRGLRLAMGEWAMNTIRRRLREAAAANDSPRDTLRAMIYAFAELAVGSPSVYRFCSPAVSADDDDSSGFFSDIADLLRERMYLHTPEEQLWAAGTVGFVRASTEQWLASPTPIDDFADQVSRWLVASFPSHHVNISTS